MDPFEAVEFVVEVEEAREPWALGRGTFSLFHSSGLVVPVVLVGVEGDSPEGSDVERPLVCLGEGRRGDASIGSGWRSAKFMMTALKMTKAPRSHDFSTLSCARVASCLSVIRVAILIADFLMKKLP